MKLRCLFTILYPLNKSIFRLNLLYALNIAHNIIPPHAPEKGWYGIAGGSDLNSIVVFLSLPAFDVRGVH